jgi:hypothetical protein
MVMDATFDNFFFSFEIYVHDFHRLLLGKPRASIIVYWYNTKMCIVSEGVDNEGGKRLFVLRLHTNLVHSHFQGLLITNI